MKRFISQEFPKGKTLIELSDEETLHARSVFKVKQGEKVEVLNGEGQALCVEIALKGKKVFLKEILGQSIRSADLKRPEVFPIHLYCSVLKGEGMQWLIEKSVELGVQSLHPLISERTIPNLRTKGSTKFQERWQTMADQALKQCGRLRRLQIYEPLNIQDCQVPDFSCLLVEPSLAQDVPPLHLALKDLRWKEVHLFVGPEGGWSEKDIETLDNSSQHPIQRCTLSHLTLRAETAALAAVLQSSLLIVSAS